MEIYRNYLRSLTKVNDSCRTSKSEILVRFVVEWFAGLNLCTWLEGELQTCHDAEVFDLFPTVCLQTSPGTLAGHSATEQ